MFGEVEADAKKRSVIIKPVDGIITQKARYLLHLK